MLDSYIIRWVEQATDLLLNEVQKQTPEDTWNLQSNNKKINVSNSNWIISWWVINETPYALFVEYWVQSKQYNYYKDWGRKKWWSPFYRGIGARMFTKAQFENQRKVRDIILSQINKGIKDFNSKK